MKTWKFKLPILIILALLAWWTAAGLQGQLLVQHDGHAIIAEETWRSRRMTLAPIGENTGSKSQCFYVIFDTHMVVKIPPAPIIEFEDKYGKAGLKLWPDLNWAYQVFQKEINSAMVQSDEHIDLSDWQTKSWFLSRMAGRDNQGHTIEVSDRFNTLIETRLGKIDASQSEVGRQYRQLILQQRQKPPAPGTKPGPGHPEHPRQI